MRDKDKVERRQAEPGIGQSAGDAQPAIDDDHAAANLKQRGTRPRPARPDRRTALAAEKNEAVQIQDQSPSGVPLKRFFNPAQQSM
ncbi:hypothetical protein MesoLj131a_40620 [Mesorhizobium sp. 131-2-1]|nr:hypothetical protein MesoLj131a_40620 [Mesorhizobium sp. 131-2-1]